MVAIKKHKPRAPGIPDFLFQNPANKSAANPHSATRKSHVALRLAKTEYIQKTGMKVVMVRLGEEMTCARPGARSAIVREFVPDRASAAFPSIGESDCGVSQRPYFGGKQMKRNAPHQ